MTFTAGQKLRASELNEQGVLVARASRVTSTGASTGSTVGIVRLDDVPVTAGRAYSVHAHGGLYPTSINGGRVDVTVRYTVDGSTPSVSSSVLALRGVQLFTAQFVEAYDVDIVYVPSVNETLSLLLCFSTVITTDATQSYGATSWPTEITVTDLGADPGDTGVDI